MTLIWKMYKLCELIRVRPSERVCSCLVNSDQHYLHLLTQTRKVSIWAFLRDVTENAVKYCNTFSTLFKDYSVIANIVIAIPSLFYFFAKKKTSFSISSVAVPSNALLEWWSENTPLVCPLTYTEGDANPCRCIPNRPSGLSWHCARSHPLHMLAMG